MEEKSSEYKKGLWTVEEDRILMDYIRVHGKGKWNRIPKVTGLKRCGKSCRLRWINYLSPGVKRGDFSEEEDDLIIRLHNLLGNRWSLIAGRVPGRTDNQVKNHWNTHLSKRLGIKKGKNKVISCSSRASTRDSRQDFSSSTGPDSAIPPKVMARSEGESQNAADNCNGAQAGLIAITGGDDYESSSWFFRDELKLQYTPNVMMEFLDESLDFVWHGL